MKYVKTRIPCDASGNPCYLDLALVILAEATKAPAGQRVSITANLEGTGPEVFRWAHDGQGGLIVERACLGTRFTASLYMAIEDLAPEKVRAA